jgi:hypothetical protein
MLRSESYHPLSHLSTCIPEVPGLNLNLDKVFCGFQGSPYFCQFMVHQHNIRQLSSATYSNENKVKQKKLSICELIFFCGHIVFIFKQRLMVNKDMK